MSWSLDLFGGLRLRDSMLQSSIVARRARFLAFMIPTEDLSASLSVTISVHSSMASRNLPSSERKDVGRCGTLLVFEWVGVLAGVVSGTRRFIDFPEVLPIS